MAQEREKLGQQSGQGCCCTLEGCGWTCSLLCCCATKGCGGSLICCLCGALIICCWNLWLGPLKDEVSKRLPRCDKAAVSHARTAGNIYEQCMHRIALQLGTGMVRLEVGVAAVKAVHACAIKRVNG